MTTTTAGATPLPGSAIKRLSIVLSAVLMPFLLALALSGLFKLFGDYSVTPSVSIHTEFARITYPDRKTAVGQTFVARGTIDKLPANTTAYLMVKRGELYWPKKELGQKAGAWSQEIKEAKHQKSQLYLVVLALNTEEKAIVQQWYATSKATGKYPGISQFTAARKIEAIAAIEVKQK